MRGTNERIKELALFRKITPPSSGSQLIFLHNPKDLILNQFSVGNPDFRLMVVGTYDTDDIGASCYHNNLAILENVISHLVDTRGNLVTDMVAGIDAFANILHAQFDMLALAVEPTKRGVEAYKQYQKLANDAGSAILYSWWATRYEMRLIRVLSKSTLPKIVYLVSSATLNICVLKIRRAARLMFLCLKGKTKRS